MATLIAILSNMGQWLLKIFLGGLSGKVMQQAEDEGQHKIDASVVHAQTTTDSADVSVQIVKDESKVKDHYNDKPENKTDPFDNQDWNDEVKQ